MVRKSPGISLAAWLTCAAAPAFAEDPLGLYVGAGIGESTINTGGDGYGYGYGYDGYYGHHDFAWKVMAGLRPISIVGAEVEYIDFGHPNGNGFYGGYGYSSADSHPRALAAFGVGHLPLPLPFVDVFGKLGVAHLRTEVSGYAAPACGPNVLCSYGTQYPTAFSQSRWDTRFAYGAGIQSSVFGVNLRAEYERINSPFGDPDLVSVGVTFNF